MQSEKSEQRNEIAKLLGIQDKIDRIVEKDEGFVIKNIHNLDSRKHKIAELLTKYSVNFEGCTFEFLEIKGVRLNNTIAFVQCTFLWDVSFEETRFYKKINFQKSCFQSSVNFSNSRFYEEANFSNIEFGSKTDGYGRGLIKFNNSKFQKLANFSNTYFGKDTYFHRCIFFDNFQIYRSRFAGVANFYFASFSNKGLPNFSACVFENPKLANFVGVDLSTITKNNIEQCIKNQAKDESQDKDNKDKKRNESILRIQHARNIKDSFRVVKDVLLTQNNSLEAQIWHKLELYAKEIEIEFKIEDEQKKKQKNYAKFGWNFEKNILNFYRLISDHHNNFSLILNTTIYTIVFHGMSVWLLSKILFMNFFSPTQITNTLAHFIILAPFLLAFLSAIIGLIFYYFFKKRFFAYIFSNIGLYIFICFFVIMALIFINGGISILYGATFAIVCIYCFFFFLMLSILKYTFFRFLIYGLFSYIFISNPSTLNPLMGVFKERSSADIIIKQYIETNEFLKIQEQLNECKWIHQRFDRKIKDYYSLKSILIPNSKLFLEMCSKEDEKQKKKDEKKQSYLSNEFELALIKNEIFNQSSEAINIIYLITLILCIFSLQKTARKNSIIPS